MAKAKTNTRGKRRVKKNIAKVSHMYIQLSITLLLL